MAYEPLPEGKYIAQLAVPKEGSTTIDVAPIYDRDGNEVGGLVCNMVLDVCDEDGTCKGIRYLTDWRGVRLALTKPTPKCPDGLLPFNWDKLVQIFGLSSRAEVLDLGTLAQDPARGPAIMATKFELHVKHETYQVKDSHGMPTGETRTAERMDIQPLGYIGGGAGLRETGHNAKAALNRFRTLIMASKAPVTAAAVAQPATPAPAAARVPARPAVPTRTATPPANTLAKDPEDPDATKRITIDDLWSRLLAKYGNDKAVATAELVRAADLVPGCAGVEFCDLTPEQCYEIGCHLDIGLLPF